MFRDRADTGINPDFARRYIEIGDTMLRTLDALHFVIVQSKFNKDSE